ncbi:hypothetical protein Purlil1_5471 [Purpureocillium lilacinum]|uniref:Uncharacterized protein n=1 Tax=Purpureocillium lilacinum TaxID=33203 RepID=A0ABR0C260_PURLI|nr:hypothetical protein Purlil1_5471 [Purpureocillium lilacinum]
MGSYHERSSDLLRDAMLILDVATAAAAAEAAAAATAATQTTPQRGKRAYVCRSLDAAICWLAEQRKHTLSSCVQYNTQMRRRPLKARSHTLQPSHEARGDGRRVDCRNVSAPRLPGHDEERKGACACLGGVREHIFPGAASCTMPSPLAGANELDEWVRAQTAGGRKPLSANPRGARCQRRA